MNDYTTLLVDAIELRAKNGLGTPSDLFIKLQNSACAEKLIIFRDERKRPIAYIAWAAVNKESALRFLKSGRPPFYPGEWNEGGISLILDIFVQKNARYDAVKQIKSFIFNKRAITFSKRNICKLYLKHNGKLLQRKFTK